MPETSTMKVHEIAKDLKLSSKEVISKLAEYGVEVKGHMSTLTEEQASLVFDIFTTSNKIEETELTELRDQAQKAQKAAEEKAAAEAKAAAEKAAAEKAEAEKAAAEKAAAEKAAAEKAAAGKAAMEKAAAQKAAEEKAIKEQKKKKKQPAQKQSGTKIDLASARDTNDEEAIVITTEERKRYVDTRQSVVELEAIESRERIEEMVPENIKTDTKNRGKKNKRNRQRQEPERQNAASANKAPEIKEVEIPDTVTVGEFSQRIGKSAAEIVKKLMMLGIMATITQSIDFETASLIADDFGITVKREIIMTKEDILLQETEQEDKEEDLVPRPPVVVVMGHVDHGKTSLLDAIRDTSVIDTEAGGITQHIGAYSVRLNDRDITFLDTPGHEAFTTMRARGAQVTDVAILVVAADDGIMPQTIEAINHAKAAGVTVVVAINKIDKEGANPERVKQMLVEHGLVPEEWGGDTVCVEISAKKRINIDGLLEMVLLVADMKELKANPNRKASGAVIEAQIDKGRGPVATVLVQNGTLHVGDFIIAGTAVGRVRAMVNDKGRRVKTAGPSASVEVLGLSEAPSGGDQFAVVENEKLARDVASQRRQEQQEDRFNAVVKVSLDNLFSQIDEGNMKELDVIIKADVQGSVEAVRQSLEKLSNEQVRVRAIHGGVGAINESDVMLANASNAIIVGFNVRPDAGALSAAQTQDVDIRLYRVIYQAIEEIEAAMKGMLEPEFKEVVHGYADVRQTFKVTGVGTIAGCYVTSGKIIRNADIRLVRDGIIIHEGKIDSLKRFKDDAKEVQENFECGLGIENFNDVKDGDTIECFTMEEIQR